MTIRVLSYGFISFTIIAVIFMLLAAPPSQAQTGSATYVYDALGRLASVTYNNGYAITYSYDAAGNRTATVTTSQTLYWTASTGGSCTTNCWTATTTPCTANCWGSTPP